MEFKRVVMDAKRTLALLFALCLVSFTVVGIYFDQHGAGAFWTPVADPEVGRRYHRTRDIGKHFYFYTGLGPIQWLAHQRRKVF